jgi:hypothetical protein
MRTILAFATIFLVATTAYCHEEDTLDQLQEMANTKFGKTVLETIQVELQTNADPRPKIIQLLDELISDTTTQRTTNTKDFNLLEKHHLKIQADAKIAEADATTIIDASTTR